MEKFKLINKIKTRINWFFLGFWWIIGIIFFVIDYIDPSNTIDTPIDYTGIYIPSAFTVFIFLIVSIDGLYKSFK